MRVYYMLTIGDSIALGDYKRELKVWEKRKLPSKQPRLWQLIKEENNG